MKALNFYLCLILMSSAIFCYTEVDYINRGKYSYSYLTQTDLQTLSASDSDVYNCQNINQYYDTISNTSTMELNYSVKTHTYLHITFDAVFINIQRVPGVIKHGEIDVNGSVSTFQQAVYSDYYNCMPRTTTSKVDGKTQVSLIMAHSGNINIKIKPTDLGTVARLGISNLNINAYYCGKNAELNSSTLTCVCKSGYSVKKTPKGSRGHVYYEKTCA